MLGYFLNFYRNIKHYFKHISIHGLCTVFRGTYWPEMIFWIIIFIFAVQYFFNAIYINLIQFYNQPVTKTIDTATYPVALIPFPAVTLCNFNTVMKSKAALFIKMLVQNGIKKDLADSFLQHLSLLRNPEPLAVEPYRQIYKVLIQNGFTNDSIWMESLAQPCNEMLQSCFWGGKEVNCTDMFKRSRGDFGFCCSFNSNLYSKLREDYYTTAGPIHGLYLRFNIDVEEYVSPTYNVTGMLVLAHNKDSYASSETTFYTVVEPGKELAMKLNPELFEVEPQVKYLPTIARKCWFENEGIRLPSVNYTFENCMHLCKSKAISSMCGCIPYYYTGFGNWRECTLLDNPCLVKNYDNYSALHMKLNEHELNTNEVICECLPTCSGITYGGSTESLYYKNQLGQIQTNYSGVRIHFKFNWCKKYSISKSVTVETFIALVGGFFSLCMGGSMISACELLFYFIKSLFVKASVENDTVKHTEKENDTPLYWSEIRTFRMKSGKVNNRNVVIFNPYFQNNYIN